MIRAQKSILILAAGVALLVAACSGVKAGSGGTSGGSGGSGGGSGGSGGSGSGGSGGSGGSTGPFTIGGTVVGLTGTGLVLQNNGADDLTITPATGGGSVSFTFKTAIANAGAYKVTVKTQPSSPAQTCSVSAGSGNALANVTNVQVTCGNTFTIGGNVSGLVGSGLVLQDNGKDNLTITGTANVSFTFATPLASGATYAVTILTQPSNPGQTCTVANGTGTATSNITNVQIICPQPTFTIGGSVVGLVNGAGDTVELMNNGGDNIFVTSNNTSFTFPTPVTNGGLYDVSIFAGPTSQPQPCNIFFYVGIAKANVSSVVVDCQHNDWTWINGPDTIGGLGNYGTAALPPPPPPAADTNAPGGREYPASWTDSVGRKWLFGGFGLDVAGHSPPDLPGLLSDLWVFDGIEWIPADLPVTTTTNAGVTIRTASRLPIQTTDSFGGTTPGSRWGSVTWTNASGNLVLFGGQGFSTGNVGFLNDTWTFTPGSYDNINTPTERGSFTFTGNWVAGTNSGVVNDKGNYGTLGTAAATNIPSGRWGAAHCTDSSGNVWVFGGQGVDSTGTNLVLLNDLWRFNIASGQWTWLGPTNSNASQNNGVYGTQGTALAANAPGPGGRQAALLWADNLGNIWLFGGLGLDSVGTRNAGSLNGGLPNGTTPDGALLNDLWKYNIASGQWTWVSGGGATGLANQTGVYGTAGTAAAGNIPGSRWSAVGFADASGNLWLFGGWGYASIGQTTGFLNDVWEYHQGLGQWIWWKGSSDVNQNGDYPKQFSPSLGVPFITNTPGARRGPASWQQDSLEYFWVFSGQGFDSSSTSNGYLNDLWTYLPFPKYPNQ